MATNDKIQASDKSLTITLTSRRPATINPREWPIIASGDGDSYGSTDPSGHRQAVTRGEVDIYRLRVRQHQDGRVLVYGILDGAGQWTGTESRAGGELHAGSESDLGSDQDLVDAIKRVGHDCRLPESVIRDCIADLPAEEI